MTKRRQSHSTRAAAVTGTKPMLLIQVYNHFDLIWRRCWDRRYDFKGKRYASASDIEDAVITDSLQLARQDQRYRFEIESTAVARQYLRRHPRRQAELRRLIAQGRVHVPGAGETSSPASSGTRNTSA
jgi:hypothetical protein